MSAVEEDRKASFEHVLTNSHSVLWAKARFDERDFPYSWIRQQAVTGSAVSTLTEGGFGIPTLTNVSSDFKLTASNLFFTSTQAGSNAGSIVRVSLEDGGLTTLLTFDDVTTRPGWAADDLGLVVDTDIQGLAGGDCTAADLEDATCPPPDSHVAALDGDTVYVQAVHSLWRLPRQGGMPVALARTSGRQAIGWEMAIVDETNVYFELGQGLASVPKIGGTVTILAVETDLAEGISSLTQDGQYLYVICGSRRVVAVPKP